MARILDEADVNIMEWQELQKSKKNLILYNVQESNSNTHVEHIAHDNSQVREFLWDHLGFDNLEISYLSHFRGVTLASSKSACKMRISSAKLVKQ